MDVADAGILAYLSEELMELLISGEQYAKAWSHFESMPEEIRNLERHMVPAAEAAFHLKNHLFLEQAFASDFPQIREGDRRMVDLWYRYRQAAKPDGTAAAESAKPPRNIGFWMVES